MFDLKLAFLLVGLSVVLGACGPTTQIRTRMIYEPYLQNENIQTRDGITVELKHAEKFPPTFYVSLPACNQYGQFVVDNNGNPVMEQVAYGDWRNQYWEQVALTNNTDHVIRMNGVVIRLFDPAGNHYELLSHEDLMSILHAKRPCSSTMQASYQFKINPIFSRNMEVVPGTTTTFWIPFQPASKQMEGVWKFAIYEVPVKLDAAGTPVRKTKFEVRMVARMITDTYRQDGMFSQPTLISTTGNQTQPAVSPAVAPQSSYVVNKEVTIKAQAKLNELGYDAGPADGIAGIRTRAAISKFQSDHGIATNGELDAQTLELLLENK